MIGQLQTLHWNTESNHNKFLSYIVTTFRLYFLLPICLILIHADNVHLDHCGLQKHRHLTEEMYLASNVRQTI